MALVDYPYMPIDELDLARTLHNLLTEGGLDFARFGPPDAEAAELTTVTLRETSDGRTSLRLTLRSGQQFSLSVDALR
jgi:hypothetical protein